jgi:hypothetical protein
MEQVKLIKEFTVFKELECVFPSSEERFTEMYHQPDESTP